MVDTENNNDDDDSDSNNDNDEYQYTLEEGETIELGTCACCGNDTRVAVGFLTRVYDENTSEAAAAYHVRWTVGRGSEEGANVDIMIMDDDDEGTILVSLELICGDDDNGRGCQVVDSAGRPLAEMADRVLTREQVLSSPEIKDLAFELVGAIAFLDGRIQEVADAGYL